MDGCLIQCRGDAVSNDGIALLGVGVGLSAEELVAKVVREAEQENALASICLTSSFQTEDMVVLHMLREHLPCVPVIFLETGYHFKELIAYRDRMVEEWGLNLINAMPSTSVREFEGQFGKLHIVQP